MDSRGTLIQRPESTSIQASTNAIFQNISNLLFTKHPSIRR